MVSLGYSVSSLPGHAMSRACAIQVLRDGDRVAVVCDGKLGLLVAQLLALQRHSVTHSGKRVGRKCHCQASEQSRRCAGAD